MKTLLKPMFAVISPAQVAEILAPRFGVKPDSCGFWAQGVNDVYRLTCGDKALYMRISAAGTRGEELIASEAALLKKLGAAGLSVAQPLPNRDGGYVESVVCAGDSRERYAALFEEARGEVAGARSRERGEALGALVAGIHSASDGYTGAAVRIDSEYLIDQPLAELRRYFADSEYLQRIELAACRLRAAIDDCFASGDVGIIHGDLHNYNIRFDGDKPTIFDFDSFGIGPRAYDLAVQRWNIARLGLPEMEGVRQWEAFAAGYGGVRRIPDGGLMALVAARELWLAGLRLRSTRINRDCGWVNGEFIRSAAEFIEIWSAALI